MKEGPIKCPKCGDEDEGFSYRYTGVWEHHIYNGHDGPRQEGDYVDTIRHDKTAKCLACGKRVPLEDIKDYLP